MEMNGSDKHFSALKYGNNNGYKTFYTTGSSFNCVFATEIANVNRA